MIRGEATAALADGRTLTLAIGFRALALASADTKIPAKEMFDVLKTDDGRQTLALLSLIENSLKKYHRDIGQDELDELMLSDSEALSEALSTALNGAFTDDEPVVADEGNARTGTGTRSKGTGRKRA